MFNYVKQASGERKRCGVAVISALIHRPVNKRVAFGCAEVDAGRKLIYSPFSYSTYRQCVRRTTLAELIQLDVFVVRPRQVQRTSWER